MPPLLYELFCLAKPGLPKGQLGAMINLAGKKVLEGGGVLTDIKYFGDQPLAYEVRKTGAKYIEASMWQVTFASNPRVLSELDHALRVDEQVLRWVVMKRQAFSPLPNTFKVARLAEQVMKEELASQKQ